MKCIDSRHLKSGFSLFELSVALAVGTMLMIALVGVLRSSHLQLRVAEEQMAKTEIDEVRQLIEFDLTFASQISERDGRIWIEGDFRSFESRRPSRLIAYACEPWINGDSALVRTKDSRTDLAAIGFAQLNVERVDTAGVGQPLSPDWSALPKRLRVRLTSSTGRVFSFDIVRN